MNKIQLLKCLVGSRAHGTHREDSDTDYRGVHICPTSEFLSLGAKMKDTDWVEGESEDQTSYEIGYFLKMACLCHPNYLEVFKAPIIFPEPVDSKDDSEWRRNAMRARFANELRDLFPYIWNPEDAFKAYTNYATNNRNKMLTMKDERTPKFAIAYVRTIYNLGMLLTTNDFSLKVPEGKFLDYLLKIKRENINVGEIIDRTEVRIRKCMEFKNECNQVPDLKRVNDFLLKIRKHYWEI